MLLSFIFFSFSVSNNKMFVLGVKTLYWKKKKKKASIVLPLSTFNLTTLATFYFLF